MPDRRKFIQSCLSALVGASVVLPSHAWSLMNPLLTQNSSLIDEFSSVVERGLSTGSRFKVFGIGGGGSNAAIHMIESGVTGMEYIFANTDTYALNRCTRHKTIQLHRKSLSTSTKLGSCREIAELATENIRLTLDGAQFVFITVGMGGGTGTEAAPVIGRIAKDMGITTVALATMPFRWEGVRRIRHAEIGLAELQAHVDTVIVLPNDHLLEVLGEHATIDDAFDHANEMMKNAIVEIAETTMAEPRRVPTDRR